jgi:hypothetical protein
MHALFTIVLVAAVALAELMPRDGCNRNNCLRAVQGTAKGTAQATLAKSDCSKFLQTTVTSFQESVKMFLLKFLRLLFLRMYFNAN